MDAYAKYFLKHPPTHMLVAWFMDYKEPGTPRLPPSMTPQEELPEIEE